MALQIDSPLFLCYHLTVSESLPWSPTAEELYTDYKTAYSELENARCVVPPINEIAAEAIEIADRLISASNLDIEARQEFLNKLAIMKNISMAARLKMQRLNIICAETKLDFTIIIAQYIYAEKRDELHAEALDEDRARNK